MRRAKDKKGYIWEAEHAAERYFGGEPWEKIAPDLSKEAYEALRPGFESEELSVSFNFRILWHHFRSASALRRALDAPAQKVLAKEIKQGYLEESISSSAAYMRKTFGDDPGRIVNPSVATPAVVQLAFIHHFWQRKMVREEKILYSDIVRLRLRTRNRSTLMEPDFLFLMTTEEWIKNDICKRMVLEGRDDDLSGLIMFRESFSKREGSIIPGSVGIQVVRQGASSAARFDRIDIWDILDLFRKTLDKLPGGSTRSDHEERLQPAVYSICNVYIDKYVDGTWLDSPEAAKILDIEVLTERSTCRVFDVFGGIIEGKLSSMDHYLMVSLPENLHLMLKTVFVERMTAPIRKHPLDKSDWKCLFDLFITGSERLAKWLSGGLPSIVTRSPYREEKFDESLRRLRVEGDGLFVSALTRDPELMKMFSEYISKEGVVERIGLLFPGAVTAATISRSAGSAEPEFFEEMSL